MDDEGAAAPDGAAVSAADKARRALLLRLVEATRAAGALALRWWEPGGTTRATIRYKGGRSPVTEADLEADRALHDALRPLVPDAAWLSEETADNAIRLRARRVLVVDPIDGTRAFLSGGRDWCVSVALVENGAPVLGVLVAPAAEGGEEVWTAAGGLGAWRNGEALAVSRRSALSGARVAGPGDLAERVAGALKLKPAPRVRSLALRPASVAAAGLGGTKADAPPELAFAKPGAHDWDIAAAQLIVTEAGGALIEPDGRAPRYNRDAPRHGALAAGPPALAAELARALAAL